MNKQRCDSCGLLAAVPMGASMLRCPTCGSKILVTRAEPEPAFDPTKKVNIEALLEHIEACASDELNEAIEEQEEQEEQAALTPRLSTYPLDEEARRAVMPSLPDVAPRQQLFALTVEAPTAPPERRWAAQVALLRSPRHGFVAAVLGLAILLCVLAVIERLSLQPSTLVGTLQQLVDP